MDTIWNQIRQWLLGKAPELGQRLPGPASQKAISRVEAALGLTLPPDLRASYLVQNGAQYGVDELPLLPPLLDGVMNPAFCLLPIEGVVAEWKVWRDLIRAGEFEGYSGEPQPGIVGDWWSERWIPVAGNGGGDFLCVDMGPTAEGVVGQLILAWHDNPQRLLLASSWAEYLASVATLMEQDRLTYDQDYGVHF